MGGSGVERTERGLAGFHGKARELMAGEERQLHRGRVRAGWGPGEGAGSLKRAGERVWSREREIRGATDTAG